MIQRNKPRSILQDSKLPIKSGIGVFQPIKVESSPKNTPAAAIISSNEHIEPSMYFDLNHYLSKSASDNEFTEVISEGSLSCLMENHKPYYRILNKALT